MRLTDVADKIIGDLGLDAVENDDITPVHEKVERAVAAISPWELPSFFARSDPPSSMVEQQRVVTLQLMHRIREKIQYA